MGWVRYMYVATMNYGGTSAAVVYGLHKCVKKELILYLSNI